MNEALFSVERTSDTLSIHMQSTMTNIDRADAETRKLLHSRDLTAHAFAICLGMREALTNAVRHGNQGKPEKEIMYKVSLDSEAIHMTIQDQGDGFDWRSRKPAASDADHGRGISIMETYFSSCIFNEKGNAITLIKQFSDPAPSPS